jgi:hypothetical protein
VLARLHRIIHSLRLPDLGIPVDFGDGCFAVTSKRKEFRSRFQRRTPMDVQQAVRGVRPSDDAGRERLPVGLSGAGVRRASSLPVTVVTLFRTAILVLAPAMMLVGGGYHPWIGNPGDPGFFETLATAVAADATRWWVAHFLIAVGSGLLMIAFLAIRSYLRDAGEDRWSVVGVPFIVMGSTLYALLPAMEFAPVAALRAGADAAAVQAAQMPWFAPILLTSAALFALGVLGFVIGIVRSDVLGPWLTWIVAGALVAMAASRFFPVGVAQLYAGPAAGVVALWAMAYAIWKRPQAPLPRPSASVPHP